MKLFKVFPFLIIILGVAHYDLKSMNNKIDESINQEEATVILESMNGGSITIPLKAALASKTIKNLIQDTGIEKPIPLTTVHTSEILELIRQGLELIAEGKDYSGLIAHFDNLKLSVLEIKCLLLAANFLDIKHLFQATSFLFAKRLIEVDNNAEEIAQEIPAQVGNAAIDFLIERETDHRLNLDSFTIQLIQKLNNYMVCSSLKGSTPSFENRLNVIEILKKCEKEKESFHLVTKSGYLPAVKNWIYKNYYKKETLVLALTSAAAYDHYDTIIYLLEKMEQNNFFSNKKKEYPLYHLLHYAINNNSTKCVSTLLEYVEKYGEIDKQLTYLDKLRTRKPLDFAAFLNHWKIVEILTLKAGAHDILQKASNSYKLILNNAIMANELEIVKILLDYETPITKQTIACLKKNSNEEVIKLVRDAYNKIREVHLKNIKNKKNKKKDSNKK